MRVNGQFLLLARITLQQCLSLYECCIDSKAVIFITTLATVMLIYYRATTQTPYNHDAMILI